ncbi:peptidylprolyl isomerase [Sphingomonas lutea]|uniref:Peptidylprolyl isomerase n=1 Tax=Sphingomonas lutea TaxID=1045317 RepID=A0A7G9SJ18_9SPHN|nr:peptidylprolyl isomerase [Sphingomonas lutea]QNN67843.1 peptidylprolyl isomerase [Sphingomonas lutea]
MNTYLLVPAALALMGQAALPKLLTPTDVVNAAPASAWKTIPADELLVMDLANGGRVVIQLAPMFAPVHVANVQKMARANYWPGATVYRVQDNYVAQWGLGETEKPLPPGVLAKPPAEYTRALAGLNITPLGSPDPYAPAAGFVDGWPVAYSPSEGWANLTHCYGYVGVSRGMDPETGSAADLYANIGHAPRHLDRNIASVGRVVEGIDKLSSLPRGTEGLGFYKDKSQHVPIASIRLASQVSAADRPAFEYMDTASPTFAQYLKIRANRRDDFYIRPAGGVDLCNVQVPVRRKPTGERG